MNPCLPQGCNCGEFMSPSDTELPHDSLGLTLSILLGSGRVRLPPAQGPHVVSFSPMHHWTEHNIRVHVFTCVLALQIAHLMRRHARQHGLDLSVRELLDTLAGIEGAVLIYPSIGGRPKARRMLTDTTSTQDRLAEIFDLPRWAPRT